MAKNSKDTPGPSPYRRLYDSHRKNQRFLFARISVRMVTVPVARHFKAEDARPCLSADLAAKAAAIRHKYGPVIGWEELQELLQDRQLTPFPCEIRFDAAPLLPGEFGHPVPKGPSREEGFIIYLHPLYADQLPR